jgi:hypothetical protein
MRRVYRLQEKVQILTESEGAKAERALSEAVRAAWRQKKGQLYE